jgi:hypothetical protein
MQVAGISPVLPLHWSSVAVALTRGNNVNDILNQELKHRRDCYKNVAAARRNMTVASREN